MEMLFKHQRDKNPLSTMRKMLDDRLIQNVVGELSSSYFDNMIEYIMTVIQYGKDPEITEQVIKEFRSRYPEEPHRGKIMTLAEHLKAQGRVKKAVKKDGKNVVYRLLEDF